MKRAITALALVGALLLSVVACQVYNPTDNSTLSTAMRSEGNISWADYSKEFTEADKKGQFEILSEYEAFRKMFKEQSAWEDAVKAYDAAVAAYEAAPSDGTEKTMKDARKAVLYTVEDLKALWDKEFDVRWDWNSKM